MSALEQVAQSDWLTLSLALLNVLQTVFLAHMAARSTQRRVQDRRRKLRTVPKQR